jgi:hypothetical protein
MRRRRGGCRVRWHIRHWLNCIKRWRMLASTRRLAVIRIPLSSTGCGISRLYLAADPQLSLRLLNPQKQGPPSERQPSSRPRFLRRSVPVSPVDRPAHLLALRLHRARPLSSSNRLSTPSTRPPFYQASNHECTPLHGYVESPGRDCRQVVGKVGGMGSESSVWERRVRGG